MTPEQSQQQLFDLIDRIQVETGGQRNAQDDPSPLVCDLGDGPTVQFTVFRVGPGPGILESAENMSGQISQIFTDEGYKVIDSGFKDPAYEVTADNGLGSQISFRSTATGMGMIGGSNCVPGDILAITENYNEEHPIPPLTPNPQTPSPAE